MGMSKPMSKPMSKQQSSWNEHYRYKVEKSRIKQKLETLENQTTPKKIYHELLLKYSKGLTSQLEFGCGTAGCSYLIARKNPGMFSYLLDISPEAINFAKRLFSEADLPFDAKVGNATRLPYEDDSIDIVHGNGVLEHIENHEKAFSELARVIRKGGKIILSVPNKFRPDGSLLNKTMRHYEYTQKEFTISELKKLCESNGLRVVEVFGYGVFYITPSIFARFFGGSDFLDKPNARHPINRQNGKRNAKKNPGFPLNVLFSFNSRYLRLHRFINETFLLPPSLSLMVGIVCEKE